jgi:hypothetical protein
MELLQDQERKRKKEKEEEKERWAGALFCTEVTPGRLV